MSEHLKSGAFSAFEFRLFQLYAFILRVLLAVSVLCSIVQLSSCAGVVDDLISARCQAKCLADFETASHASKKTSRRQLKHSIIQMCKNDVNCSSCARPCRDPFETIALCYHRVCKDSAGQEDCFRSCQFMKEISEFKPGQCPVESKTAAAYASECVSSCFKDEECSDDQKCCASGCSKFCLLPHLAKHGLLPVPSEVTVSERKRGRSAIVRWVMSRLRPEHESTHANLYVVQWRWGVRPEDEHMTKWQTISIRTKTYAILKHVLSPGRYYRLRVAAINVNGSQGFSQQSDLFRLQKSPKAPGKPILLEKGRTQTDGNLFTQEIHWTAPKSDLPIYQYQVTWWKNPGVEYHRSNDDELIADEPIALRQMQDGEHGDGNSPDYEKYEESGFLPSNTKIVSGTDASVVLDNLESDTEYYVEVHAVVESENEQLHGEKATLVLKQNDLADGDQEVNAQSKSAASDNTPSKFVSDGSALTAYQYALGTTESKYYDGIPPLVVRATAEMPYFQNGLLKVLINWDAAEDVAYVSPNSTFLIAWWPQVCLGASQPEFALTKPLTALTKSSSFELYELQFACHYLTSVSVVESEGKVFGRATRLSFETPTCQDVTVKGDIMPVCPSAVPEAPSSPEDLNCSVIPASAALSEDIKNITADCRWRRPASSDTPITGYRVISGQRSTHESQGKLTNVQTYPSIDRATAVIKALKSDTLEVRLHSLLPGTDYVVQVQAISDIGLSPAVHISFQTPAWSFDSQLRNELKLNSKTADTNSLLNRDSDDESVDQRFDSNEQNNYAAGSSDDREDKIDSIETERNIVNLWSKHSRAKTVRGSEDERRRLKSDAACQRSRSSSQDVLLRIILGTALAFFSASKLYLEKLQLWR